MALLLSQSERPLHAIGSVTALHRPVTGLQVFLTGKYPSEAVYEKYPVY